MIQASPQEKPRLQRQARRAAGALVAAVLIGLAGGATAHADPYTDPYADPAYDPWLGLDFFDDDPGPAQFGDSDSFDSDDPGYKGHEYYEQRQRQREWEWQQQQALDLQRQQYYEQQTREAIRDGARMACSTMTGNPIAQQRCYERLR